MTAITPRGRACSDLAKHASERARGRGVFVGAGCAYGATTVFLGKLMQQWSYQYPYYALDTFAGFTGRDVAIEVAQRGKPRNLATDFVVND